MTKREKIIVGVMAVTVALGAANLLSTPKKSPATTAFQQQRDSNISAFVSQMSAGLMQGINNKEKTDIQYVVDRASGHWEKDPFLGKEAMAYFEDQKRLDEEKLKTKSGPLELVNLAYTGYLAAGDQALAVINGLEYEVGDYLEIEGGYLIRSISASQVVVGREGTTERIVLPMEESE